MSFNLIVRRPAAMVLRRNSSSIAATTKVKYQVTSQPYDSPSSTNDVVNGEFWAGEPGLKKQREEAIYKSSDARPTLDLMARAHHIHATQSDV
ncbi:hypothetical protein INT44_002046 [Umbelopsis vinacea]|uniref:Uncharacterized protein n=1 Tax=Umbelopsis vinacea TaxID=44442 RepID=A0A8H7UGT9_9FUNG|nr:hypothetical protein INT44_002046 [Umbelopsis vinacea]